MQCNLNKDYDLIYDTTMWTGRALEREKTDRSMLVTFESKTVGFNEHLPIVWHYLE